jgi:hypothetical protein
MSPLRSHPLACGLLAAGLAVGLACAAAAADPSSPPGAGAPQAVPAPAPPQGTRTPQPGKPSVSTQAPIRPAAVRSAPPQRAESQPTWAELTPAQQAALSPLSASWRSLGEAHKRKWIALSQNFATVPPAEQARLHSRMTEWAALSPQQRNLARLNFAEAQKVAPDDKRAKWEAYQALPPEEKRKLAAGAAAAKPAPPPTAVAVQPVPQQKLARIPKSSKPDNAARIAVVPGRVDNNTLLPHALPSAQP